MAISKQRQIVELQDAIDSLTRMKLNLQQQTGATTFSEVVSSYSTERAQQSFSAEGSDIGGEGGTKQQRRHRDELRKVRSQIDRLFSSLE